MVAFVRGSPTRSRRKGDFQTFFLICKFVAILESATNLEKRGEVSSQVELTCMYKMGKEEEEGT